MRVDGYSGLQGTGPLDPNKDKSLAGASQAGAAGTNPLIDADQDGDAGGTTDTIEISDKARELLAGGTVSTATETSSAIRPEAVDRARKVLQAGTYNDLGALEKTAERIADRFSAEG